jgi:SAM-dependent methyltransferase
VSVDPRRALSFGSGATAYATGRPSYPVGAVSAVLPRGAKRVLDLGAGTGKLTTTLLSLGLEVVAVEPDDAMRALIDPRAQALAGTAEALPAVGMVDAVVVGQAWHWFDAAAALASVRSVLRPGGTLGLLWNLLDDRDGWAKVLADAAQMEDRLTYLNHADARPFEDAPDDFGPWERRVLEHSQVVDASVVLANLGSRSTVLLLPEEERQELVSQVAAQLPAGQFEVRYVCDTWWATYLGDSAS